jgi:hypothetical protein
MITACPPGTHLVVFDDNIFKFKVGGRKALPGEWLQVVQQAWTNMHKHGVFSWSINHCSNLFGARPSHEPQVGLYLLYGANFGIRVDHDQQLLSRLGEPADDLERALRYFSRDGGIIRFSSHQLQKFHKPGSFGQGKGGIAANFPTKLAHWRAMDQHVQLLVLRFPDLLARIEPRMGSTCTWRLLRPRALKRT